MIRTRIAAAVAALALAVSGQASAEETTTVGYSTDLSAYINAIYRPGVTNVDPASVVAGATKAECKYDATGVGSNGQIDDTAVIVLVAKVVSTATKPSAGPVNGLPAATGVGCELRNVDGTVVVGPWEALRPGNAAYNATVVTARTVRRVTICVWAFVYFGDGTRRDHPRRCESPLL